MTKKQTAKKSADSAAVVYCGPTIRGVAKRFTVYREGIPPALQTAAEERPALAALVVPLKQLPEAMRQLREKTGPIYTLYGVVQGKH